MKSLPSKLFLAGCITAALGSSWSGAIGQDAAKQAAVNAAGTKLRLKLAGVSADALEMANKIIDEHSRKIAEAMSKKDATLTPAQRQTLSKATRDAALGVKDGTKKLDDISADTAAAFKSLNVPAAQKAKYDVAHQAVLDAMRAQNEALRPLLTPQQQTKMGIPPLPKSKTK